MVILQLNFTRFFKAFQFNKNGRKGRKKECRVRKKASSGMEGQRVPYLLEIKKSLILLIICLLFHVVRKKMVITAKQTVHFFYLPVCKSMYMPFSFQIWKYSISPSTFKTIYFTLSYRKLKFSDRTPEFYKLTNSFEVVGFNIVRF